MMIAWEIFRSSRLLQGLALVLGLYAAFQINNAHQRSIGASTITQKVEGKANADAAVATEVRTDVAAGKRGRVDPSRVR